MFHIVDANKDSIKHFTQVECFKKINITIHNTNLVSYFASKQSVTLFYGYLDQTIQFNNQAQFLGERLNQSGVSFLNECYGSFIIVHYDLINHKLILANDALGDFAAHYEITPTSINVSELPEGLLNKDNSEINKQRVAQFFKFDKPSNGSYFKHVLQLSPGQALTLSTTTKEITQYYQPPTKVDFTITETSAQKQLKQKIRQAITQQTQGQNHIGILMSGGLDSTFVTANCTQLNKQVDTFSYVFPNMPQADEAKWLDSMAQLDINMFKFEGEDFWPLKPLWPVSINSPLVSPYRHLKSHAFAQANKQGVQTILTGDFADHLYSGYKYWLVDLVKSKPVTAIKFFFKILKTHGINKAIRQVSPKKWLSKKHSHQHQFDLVYSVLTAQSVWSENADAFKNGVIIRHPFRDRRVVEFLMSVPAWILGDIIQPKTLVRNAGENILPKVIVTRTKITTLEPLFLKGLLDKEFTQVEKLLNGSKCKWQEFTEPQPILSILQNPKAHHSDKDLLNLWLCICFELWQKKINKLK